jgi:hemerythrin-like domain-containing protein
MAENILNLMITQHGFLESLFSTFQIEIREGSEKSEASLSEFTWEMKKHFFVEEEIIFNFMSWKEPVIFEIINQLKKEHSIMIEMLVKMSENLKTINGEDTESFFKLLKSHRDIEEKNLYPRLDKSLSGGQKEQIINRINQIKK